tara:strand:+ start:1500 stop:2507 length:1008 start_codon:yes stop_codon:yes gene_type:complete
MGIKNLYKYILSNNLERDLDPTKLRNKIIAIDISILLYQVVISTRSKCGVDHLSPTGEMSTHVLGLFNKTIILLKKKIIPIFVFDGKPPDLKKKTLNARKDVRQKALAKLKITTDEKERIKYLKRSVSINKKHLNECRNLLDCLGIPYVDAPEEADSQCSYLAYCGLVDGVLTEDMDIFTFGSPIIYKNLYSSKKSSKIIDLKEILYHNDLKFDEFVEWCCLLGSDYSKGIIDLNFNEILDLYKNQGKNINNVIEYCNKNNLRCCPAQDYINVKKYFKNPKIINVTNKELELKMCDIKRVTNLMVNRFGFNKSKLIKKLSYLKNRNKYLLKRAPK